ncbi:hypothetical protein K2173_012260 [Erythroxylum novogranatense]|uniref:Cell division control protein n=1 Tax=Erythroxylum novogranatense TaxID=1862640 RepID=A0AAV8SC52_9ROSI|nr:hypothetical protein K2173_012260 [Erythroxylum novogranatense]
MPSIYCCNSSPNQEIGSNCESTPQKRRLRSNSTSLQDAPICTPKQRKSPRSCFNSGPSTPLKGKNGDSDERPGSRCQLPVMKLSSDFKIKPDWQPNDVEHLGAVKAALHVSTAPSTVLCREDEQKKVFDFCKNCIEQGKAGSLYLCGLPGTGKSLSMEKVKQHLLNWSKESGCLPPDIVALNCTSLTKTSEIFSKIIGKIEPRNSINRSITHLQHLQNLYSQELQSSRLKMMVIIADELDYLITKDRALLHDLFMLTTLPFSRCILIGIANAIDLADRFLPKLQSLNCSPIVITFRAYSADQILTILQDRLMGLPYTVFQPQALELCARRVAAASGDITESSLCLSTIEILEGERRDSITSRNSASMIEGSSKKQTTPAFESHKEQENILVRIDHMAAALSKAYRTPIVDTIQSLPQHQQMILCSAVKTFRRGKKDSTLGELNKHYVDICKSTMIPPVGNLEFTSMCGVLNDQGLLKLGQSRDERSKRVALKVDEADITFALQGVRLFRNCLQ